MTELLKTWGHLTQIHDQYHNQDTKKAAKKRIKELKPDQRKALKSALKDISKIKRAGRAQKTTDSDLKALNKVFSAMEQGDYKYKEKSCVKSIKHIWGNLFKKRIGSKKLISPLNEALTMPYYDPKWQKITQFNKMDLVILNMLLATSKTTYSSTHLKEILTNGSFGRILPMQANGTLFLDLLLLVLSHPDIDEKTKQEALSSISDSHYCTMGLGAQFAIFKNKTVSLSLKIDHLKVRQEYKLAVNKYRLKFPHNPHVLYLNYSFLDVTGDVLTTWNADQHASRALLNQLTDKELPLALQEFKTELDTFELNFEQFKAILTEIETIEAFLEDVELTPEAKCALDAAKLKWDVMNLVFERSEPILKRDLDKFEFAIKQFHPEIYLRHQIISLQFQTAAINHNLKEAILK